MSITRIAITRIQAALAACLMLASCGDCGDVRVRIVTSPDGGLKATFFVRDCVSTTNSNSTVNVQPADAKFNAGEGRVFVANGKHDISLEWTGPRILLVKCSTCSRKDVFQQNKALGDIEIGYSFGSPAGANSVDLDSAR